MKRGMLHFAYDRKYPVQVLLDVNSVTVYHSIVQGNVSLQLHYLRSLSSHLPTPTCNNNNYNTNKNTDIQN